MSLRCSAHLTLGGLSCPRAQVVSERVSNLVDALVDVNRVVVGAFVRLCHLEQVLVSGAKAIHPALEVEVFCGSVRSESLVA